VGSKEGFWMQVEVLNVPWEDAMADFNSQENKDARNVIQKAVSA
jgi:hypothetical protein